MDTEHQEKILGGLCGSSLTAGSVIALAGGAPLLMVAPFLAFGVFGLAMAFKD